MDDSGDEQSNKLLDDCADEAEEEEEEEEEEADWFPNAQDDCVVRRPVARRVVYSDDDDEEEEVAATPPASPPATLPHAPTSPIVLMGAPATQSQEESQEEGEGQARQFKSPFLRGCEFDPNEPTFKLQVHFDDTSQLQELLHLVDLPPKLRALLFQIQNNLNEVACVENKYFASRRGARHYGSGCSAQFLPGVARNVLFGNSCFYFDFNSAWSNALANLKRVLRVNMETHYLDDYNKDIHEFRDHISTGFIHEVAHEDRLSKAKEVILWAVHGYDNIDRHLQGDALNTLSRLSQEIGELTERLVRDPLMSPLLALFRDEERALIRREEDAVVPEADAEEEEPEGTPRRKKKRAKKKKQPELNVFVRDVIQAKSSAGERLCALYQVVESEAMEAMAAFFESQGWKIQILIHDGLVARPADPNMTINEVSELLKPCYEYIEKNTGWRMPFGIESMKLKPAHLAMLAGIKVFHALPPQQQLFRYLVYIFGEQRKMKRIGRCLLAPHPELPGLYELLRYRIQASACAGLEGTTVDASALIHLELSKSQYAAAYNSPAGSDKKLMDSFETQQNLLFEKINLKLSNIYQVRFKDGLVDFNSSNYVPTFRPWSWFEENGQAIPMHFLAYDIEYLPTLEHIRAFEAGERPDTPVPVWQKFIGFQLQKQEDQVLLETLLGRLCLPLRDGWNIALVITGPEQVGKSLILGEIKQKIPLGGLQIKVVTSKSSGGFPLGDLSNKSMLVSDEAESLIEKIGPDVLKTLISNGQLDADVSFCFFETAFAIAFYNYKKKFSPKLFYR